MPGATKPRTEPPAEPRALRADAARNRERILLAAQHVFSEHGLDASVAEVAREAGVGKATIFRSYPTKEHLIAAVAGDRVRWIEDLVTEALDQPDAWEAFKGLLVELAQRHAADLTHVEAFARNTESPLLADARKVANAAFRKLMKKAKQQGSMRADARPEDIRTLFHGVTHAMHEEERHDPKAWARWAELFANAFRA